MEATQTLWWRPLSGIFSNRLCFGTPHAAPCPSPCWCRHRRRRRRRRRPVTTGAGATSCPLQPSSWWVRCSIVVIRQVRQAAAPGPPRRPCTTARCSCGGWRMAWGWRSRRGQGRGRRGRRQGAVAAAAAAVAALLLVLIAMMTGVDSLALLVLSSLCPRR